MPQKSVVLAICIFLAALTWLVFGQTLRHEFINYDDGAYFYAHPKVLRGLSMEGVIWAFTHVHSETQNWHPLTTISHMLDYQLFGLRAGPCHFINVLLHGIGTILLFLTLRSMTGSVWRSAFVAAVFAIHPLRVESVAWVSERKDVLSGVFFMLTLGAYVRYLRSPSLGRYLTMSILFVLGLMSKPMLVSVPFVLLLLDYWPLKRRVDGRALRKLVVEKIPLFALSAAACIGTVFAQTAAIDSGTLPLLWRINNAIVTYVIYIWQMLWPAGLVPFYPHPENQLAYWQIILAGAFLVFISGAAIALRKRYPYILTAWFWYVIMLPPVIGIFQVGWQGHADRYTYLPQIGLYLLVAWAVADLTRGWRWRRAIAASAASAVIIVLSFYAWRQTSYWKNSEILWRYTLAVTPRNDVARVGLGNILLGMGKVEEAIPNFREALQMRSGSAEAHNGLAAALLQMGNVSEAIEHWRKSLELQPEDVRARDALALALVQQGRPTEAIIQWEESLKYDPSNAKALNNVAWVLAASPDAWVRNGPKAVELAQRAVELSGYKNGLIFRTLAAAYAETGRFSDAMEAAKRGLEVASEQKNSALADELQRNLLLYQRNSPFRDPGLAGPSSSL